MRQVRRADVAHSNRAGRAQLRRSALLSAKPAKTRRSKSSNFDRSLVGYAIRLAFGLEPDICPVSNIREYFSPGIFLTLAIGHTSAYMYAITDLTLGVSG